MASIETRDFTIETWAAKILGRAIFGLVVLAALVYLVDWAIWRSRVAAGGGMGQVQVDLYTVAELKGGKEDIYPQGISTVPCSKTIYPQGGNNPCWWQERHKEKMTRY